MTTSIVPGSLGAIAKDSKRSIAHAFVFCDVIVLVDTSGSMATQDSTGGRTRYEQACLELEALQKSLPGKIGVLSFADTTNFCPGGVPDFLMGGTDMAAALSYAKVADVPGSQMRFVLISDGQPNDEAAALSVAKTYRNRIDTIYVGSELNSFGRKFLTDLTQLTGGTSVTTQQVAGMAQEVHKLLATR